MTTNRWHRWTAGRSSAMAARDAAVARIYRATSGRGMMGVASPGTFDRWVARIEQATALRGAAVAGQESLLERRGGNPRWSAEWDVLDEGTEAEMRAWANLTAAIEAAPDEPAAWAAAWEELTAATEAEAEAMVAICRGD